MRNLHTTFCRDVAERRKEKVKRHWVDELSLSSEQKSEHSDTNNKPPSEKLVKNVTIDVVVTPDDEINELAAIDIIEPEPTELEPPGFICPSSEGKSREYAVRLWLSASNFQYGVRTVPIS